MRSALTPNIIRGAVEKISPTTRCRDCNNDGWVPVVSWKGRPVEAEQVAPCPCCEIGERHNRNELIYDRNTGKHTPREIPVEKRFWSNVRVQDVEWAGRQPERAHVPMAGARLVS